MLWPIQLCGIIHHYELLKTLSVIVDLWFQNIVGVQGETTQMIEGQISQTLIILNSIICAKIHAHVRYISVQSMRELYSLYVFLWQVKMHTMTYMHLFYLGLCLLTLTHSAAAGPETLCGAELVDALQFVCGDRGFFFSKLMVFLYFIPWLYQTPRNVFVVSFENCMKLTWAPNWTAFGVLA